MMCSPDTPFQWAKYTCAGSFSSTWQCVSCCRFGSASSIVVAPTDCSYPWSFISIRACLWVVPLLTGVIRYFLVPISTVTFIVPVHWPVFVPDALIPVFVPDALAPGLCPCCPGPCLCPRCSGPCLCPRCTGLDYVLDALVWSLNNLGLQCFTYFCSKTESNCWAGWLKTGACILRSI